MSLINAIILGLIQGLTEFIPISSSGHLVIVSHLLGINNAFTFDSLLNFGTLLALIIYFKDRIWSLVTRTLLGKEWLLLAKIILATIPAAIVGLILDKQIERLNDFVWVVIVMLIAVGIPMIIIGKENMKPNNQQIEKSISWLTSIKVGVAQALALLPGASRSGLTILAGLKSGLSAARAAEFSFLLAIPIITAASLKILFSSEGIDFVSHNIGTTLVGNIVSFLAGLLAVSFFISLLGKRGLKDFGWYRIGLAGVLILLAITGII
jgi:undecaprenyl-diphosphatase